MISSSNSLRRVYNYDGALFAKIVVYFYPPGNYMFKVNNRNTRTRWEICLKLTIKTPEQRHKTFRTSELSKCLMASFWCLLVNFEHISHLALVIVLLILNMYLPAG